MPSCRVTNQTPSTLNICLKQVTALHFENGVAPGQTIKFRPGRVWFTIEAVRDDGTKHSRYSVLKSAATIALLSIAIGAVAASAGAALLPEAAALGTVAAASTAGSYLAKGLTITKSALITHSGSIARLSSVALPKAIDRLSAEVGGLTALQREVLSIIASPTLSSDVRHRAAGLLRQLQGAYTSDKASRRAKSDRDPQAIPAGAAPSASLAPLSEAEARALEAEIQSGKAEHVVENRAVRTGEVLRVHGIYMDRRRQFEVRVGDGGQLELWEDGKMVD
ncbi:hypothetical protein Q5752_005702 [Cryptotrichosporon argae]